MKIESLNKLKVWSWQDLAYDWFVNVPCGTLFSADDLTRSIGLPSEGKNRNNTVGAFIHALLLKNKITFVKFTTSNRPGRNKGIQRVWRKL